MPRRSLCAALLFLLTLTRSVEAFQLGTRGLQGGPHGLWDARGEAGRSTARRSSRSSGGGRVSTSMMSSSRAKEERAKEVSVIVGRPRSLDVPEEERRMRQTVATYPEDVDALCEYACFLASVRRDFKGASEHYERAIRADGTRARRVSVQLWADMFALQVERETAFVIKERWLDLFASLPSYSEGFVPKGEVIAAALRLGVADDARLASLVDKACDEAGLVDVFQITEGLRIEPHETRYRAIAAAERVLGPAPVGEAEGDLPREASFRRAIWSLVLGRYRGRKVAPIQPLQQE